MRRKKNQRDRKDQDEDEESPPEAPRNMFAYYFPELFEGPLHSRVFMFNGVIISSYILIRSIVFFINTIAYLFSD